MRALRTFVKNDEKVEKVCVIFKNARNTNILTKKGPKKWSFLVKIVI